jgi:hypothetical protein
MSHPSPLAKEIASVILDHLSWKDLIALAVQKGSNIDESKMIDEVRRERYKNMTIGSAPLSIADLKPGLSYIVHIDEQYIYIWHYHTIWFISSNLSSIPIAVIVNCNDVTQKFNHYICEPLSLYTEMIGTLASKRDPSEYKIYPYKPSRK